MDIGLVNGSDSDGPVWSAAVSLRDKIFVDALATFSSSEAARILGVVVPLVAPQAAQALALQDLKREIRALRESVDSIRNCGLMTALDNITSALSVLQEGEFEQVIVLPYPLILHFCYLRES